MFELNASEIYFIGFLIPLKKKTILMTQDNFTNIFITRFVIFQVRFKFLQQKITTNFYHSLNNISSISIISIIISYFRLKNISY